MTETHEDIDLSTIELPDEPELCDASGIGHGQIPAMWQLIVSCGCISHTCSWCRALVEQAVNLATILGGHHGCKICKAHPVSIRWSPL